MKEIRFNNFFVEKNMAYCAFHFDNQNGLTSFDFSQYDIKIPKELDNAVEKRKCSFAWGRLCAQKAILGVDENKSFDIDIEIGDLGMPIWPVGFTGSISHSNSFCWSLAGRSENYLSIGIDSEKILDTTSAKDITSLVTVQKDLDLLQTLDFTYNEFITLLFSAKESLYKLLYPLVFEFFDFKDAFLKEINFEEKRFTLVLNRRLKDYKENQEFVGSWSKEYNHMHTVIYLKSL